MATSCFMLKILRRKREYQTQPPVSLGINKEKTSNSKRIKTKAVDFTNKCRVCLKDQGTIPIYGDKKFSTMPENIKTFAPIDLDENDDNPKKLCEACFILLQSAMLFRKMALESEKQLKEIISKNYSMEKRNYDEQNIQNNDENLHASETLTDFHVDTGFSGSEAEMEHIDIPSSNKDRTISNNIVAKSKPRTINLFDANILFPKTSNKKVRIQCSVCNSFITPQLYNRHLQRHRLASRLICEICGKTYRRDNIDVHVQSHSTDLPFQCKLCPYRGRFLISVQQHMRVHTGKKPYSCDKCPKQFTCRSNLNKHLLVHAKQRRFTCLQCGKSFYTNSNLEDHMNSYHLGIKYTCDVCGNEFATRKSLRKHELKIHKREKYLLGRPLYMQPQYNK